MELTPQLAIGFGVGIAFPLMRWLTQKSLSSLLACGDAQSQLRADLNSFKAEVSNTYVERSEFLRHITTSEAKQDAVHRRLDEVMELLLSMKKQD